MIARLLSTIQSDGLAGIFYRIRWRYFSARLVSARWLNWKVIRSSYGPYVIDDRGDYTSFVNVVGGHGDFLSEKLKRASSPFVFWDIGANHGLFTLIAARNPLCVSVVSFEPIKRTMSFLRGNAILNGVEEKIVFIEKAVSSTSGIQEISLISGHSGSGSLRPSVGQAYDKKFKIVTMDGRELVELLRDTNESIFCKIDVEGHEPQVVEQLLSQPEISKRLSALFIECDENWFDVEDLMANLTRSGFSLEKVGRGTHYDLFAYRLPEGRS